MKRLSMAALLAGIFLAVTPTHAITINLGTGELHDQNGVILADGAKLLLIASTTNASFGNLTSANLASATSFTNEPDDIILAEYNMDSTTFQAGSHIQAIVFNNAANGGPANLTAGDPLLFVWYADPVGATSPGSAKRFGTFRTDAVVDGSDTGWVVPAGNGDTVTLNFFTINAGGTQPETAGNASQITAGVASTRIIGLSGALAFGNVITGTTATASLTISNTGNASLTVSSITYPSGFSGAFSGTIPAGGAQNVTVTFAPVAVASYGGTVTVNSDKTSGTETINVSGAGVGITPTRIIGLNGALAFGSVITGTTATASLTISNTGNASLTVSSITYPSGFSGSFSGTIPAGGAQNVTVTFAPVALISYAGTVTVNSDATAGTGTIAASGTGTAAPTPIIGVSGSLVFGNVATGTAATASMTISNLGNATLTVSSITYPSGFSGAFSGTIPAGGAQNVTVTFAPVALISYAGTVTVNSDAASGNNTIAASGTGVVQPTRLIALSGNLAFGSVITGATTTASLTISNSGNATLTVSSITYPSGFSGAFSGTIPAGGAQNVTVTFAPVALINYAGNVTVNSDKTSGTNTIAASGTGIPIPTRLIALSGNLAFGSVITGATTTASLTISNSGNTTLTVSSITYPSGFSGAFSGTIPAGGSQNVTVTFAPTELTNYTGTVTVNSDKTSGTSTIAASGAGIAQPVEVHDLAVIKLAVTKKLSLSEKKPALEKTVKVTIQNRSPHNEVISNFNGVVSLDVQVLGSNCVVSTPVLITPTKLPVTLKPKQKFTVAFTVIYSCTTNPAPNVITESVRHIATVNHAAIDGNADTHPACDVCPRAALGVDPHPDGTIEDKGCGGKNPDGSLGADVLTVITRK